MKHTPDTEASSLLSIDNQLRQLPNKVTLTGQSLTAAEIIAVARNGARVELTADKVTRDRIQSCYDHMMADVKNGVPVYGSNSSFGAQADRVLTDGDQKQKLAQARAISESIQHVDVSVGPLFDKDVVRAAMLIRINMLMRGVSGVKMQDLELYAAILNADITPLVNQYGGVGASGDLAHNCRVLDAARWVSGIKVWDASGNVVEAKRALKKAGIAQLLLDPKAGLGLVNGDNFSTAVAALLAVDTTELIITSIVTTAMMVEVLKGTDRSFHPLIDKVRAHPGQVAAAALYRYLLSGSKLAYQEMQGHKIREKGMKIQDAYSLRGLSQYQGIGIEKVLAAFETIKINANSVSDNPLWVPPELATAEEPPWQWVSGGNFLAMHMVEVMDSLRKALCHTTKLNDRHLARLVSKSENNGLPANLSDPKSISQAAYKGVQIQSGMFEVYSSLLSIPVSTFFGVHEENNQDITSHALTSGIIGLELLRVSRYSMAQNLMAVTQAVDLRGGPALLSPKTRPIYEFIRAKVDYLPAEKPLGADIETVYQEIANHSVIDIIRTNVLSKIYKSV